MNIQVGRLKFDFPGSGIRTNYQDITLANGKTRRLQLVWCTFQGTSLRKANHNCIGSALQRIVLYSIGTAYRIPI